MLQALRFLSMPLYKQLHSNKSNPSLFFFSFPNFSVYPGLLRLGREKKTSNLIVFSLTKTRERERKKHSALTSRLQRQFVDVEAALGFFSFSLSVSRSLRSLSLRFAKMITVDVVREKHMVEDRRSSNQQVSDLLCSCSFQAMKKIFFFFSLSLGKTRHARTNSFVLPLI